MSAFSLLYLEKKQHKQALLLIVLLACFRLSAFPQPLLTFTSSQLTHTVLTVMSLTLFPRQGLPLYLDRPVHLFTGDTCFISIEHRKRGGGSMPDERANHWLLVMPNPASRGSRHYTCARRVLLCCCCCLVSLISSTTTRESTDCRKLSCRRSMKMRGGKSGGEQS